MLADHDTRLTACKLLLATGATYIGLGLGEPVLGMAVAGTFAAIGGNLAHDVVNNFLQRWRDNWYQSGQYLNHDIQKGLAQTFAHALRAMRDHWRSVSRGIGHIDVEAVRRNLEHLERDSQQFLNQQALLDDELAANVRNILDAQAFEQRFAAQLERYLNPEAAAVVGPHLLRAWQQRFLEYLKSGPGTAAWRACQIPGGQEYPGGASGDPGPPRHAAHATGADSAAPGRPAPRTGDAPTAATAPARRAGTQHPAPGRAAAACADRGQN